MRFHRDLFSDYLHDSIAALLLVRIFGNSRGGKVVIKRIGVGENKLVGLVDFPAADDVLVSVEDGRDIMAVQNFPKSISL